MNNTNSNTNANTSGRAGSSFRKKIEQIFRPSSRQKQVASMTNLPMSPGGGLGGSRTVITLVSSPKSNSNQENKQINAVKNVQRIRLKKKSEAMITPLPMATIAPEMIFKQPSQPSPTFMPEVKSDIKDGELQADWRLSVIEP